MGYINEYGLLNGKAADIVSENCHLITEVFAKRTKLRRYDNAMRKWIDKCWIAKGLYHNRVPAEMDGAHEDYTSPDQIIAFLSTLNRFKKKNKVKEIAKYLRDHWGNYNNLGTDKLRIQQPAVYAYAQILAGHWTSFIQVPILSASIIYSCLRPVGETSGKQKGWLMLQNVHLPLTETICRKLVKGWDTIFRIYYGEKAHPLRAFIDGPFR